MKDGKRTKEFDEVILKLIKKWQSYKLITSKEAEKCISNIDDCTIELKGVNEDGYFVKYKFPLSFHGGYRSEEEAVLWNKAKHEFQAEITSTPYQGYHLYSEVSYGLDPKEIKNIHKVLRKTPFNQMPPNELFITIIFSIETDGFDKIVDIAKEIDEYIQASRMPYTPTDLKQLKEKYDVCRKNQINSLMENSFPIEKCSESMQTEYKTLSSPEEILNFLIKKRIFTVKYEKRQYGIPIPEFIRGYNELGADMSYLELTRYPLEGVAIKIGMYATLGNESGNYYLCSVNISPNTIYEKGDKK